MMLSLVFTLVYQCRLELYEVLPTENDKHMVTKSYIQAKDILENLLYMPNTLDMVENGSMNLVPSKSLFSLL